jgi:hypothetical protein
MFLETRVHTTHSDIPSEITGTNVGSPNMSHLAPNNNFQ